MSVRQARMVLVRAIFEASLKGIEERKARPRAPPRPSPMRECRVPWVTRRWFCRADCPCEV